MSPDSPDTPEEIKPASHALEVPSEEPSAAIEETREGIDASSLSVAAGKALSATPEELEEQKPEIDPRVGQILSGWRLDAPIGRGRVAAVYAASNQDGGRAAVKVMSPEFKGDERVRRRLFREANISRFIEHPAAVDVLLNDITKSGEPFLIMPRLFGRDITRLIELHNGHLAATSTLLIALEALDFLQFCHEHGVHYRNLAPFNLYLTVEGEIRVFDFGSAFVAGEPGRQSLQAFNSDLHGYIAPELLISEDALGDHRCDFYSLGACLFTMLTGRQIGDSSGEAGWTDQTAPDIPGRIPYGKIPALASLAPNLPAALCALVDRAVSHSPSDRFSSAAEFRAAVAEVLGASSVRLVNNADDRQLALKAILAKFYSSAEELDREETGAWRSAEVLRKLFRLVENVLYAARRHGWEHGETTVRLEYLVENVLEAVSDDDEGMFWIVRPYSFEYRGEAFWEPDNPYDKITYNIFDAGFRKMHLLPGLDEDECKEFLRWLTLDPDEDLALEDDLATMFWQREFKFVRCELVSAVVLQDVEDYERLDNELQDMKADAIDHLRATIAARLSGDEGADEAADREEEQVEYVVARTSLLDMAPALLTELDTAAQQMVPLWRGRLAEIMSVSLVDARERGDSEMVMRPYATSVRVAIESDRLSDALALFAGISESLNDPEVTAELARPFIENGRFVDVMRRLVPHNVRYVYGDELPFLADRLKLLLEWTPREHMPAVVEALGRCHDRTILGLLLDYVSSNAGGFETELGKQLSVVDPLLGTNLLAILTEHLSAATIDAISHAFESKHAKIRVEAAEVLARYAPSRAYRELRKLIRHEDVRIRQRAVETIGRNKLTEGARDLLDRLAERGFHQLPLAERRAVMATAVAITDDEGEFKLAELVKSHGLTADENLDSSRLAAVEILADSAFSEGAVDALRAAAKKRWWNAKELQSAAAKAAVVVAKRIADLDRELATRHTADPEA
ncbi:MAG: serine/threonine-protein kinase [Bradymonadia bacterium]|jgi:serine/threonine-protein kinase